MRPALTDDGPAPRAHHGLATDEANGRVLLYGGLDNSQLFDDLWASGRIGLGWTSASVAVARVAELAPRLRGGAGRRASRLGGATSTSTFDSLARRYVAAGRRLLVADRRSGAVRARVCRRSATTPIVDVFVLHGGFDAEGNPLADTWEFDGNAWSCIAGC